ncbi:hypothetical protein [Dehalogenimonas sp. 4OHTPN]|uniref:Uncharacterized protein n=1 Tax=Dehalogenimonas sp. 4OHTPN TaxID=3166643 RepID=A0AAU8G724_9CHLR
MFSYVVVQQAWTRSSGRCECARGSHQHPGRCNRLLIWERRTGESKPGAWVAESKSGQFRPDASDCEIVCWQCYTAGRV